MKRCILALALVLSLTAVAEATGPLFTPVLVRRAPRRVFVPVEVVPVAPRQVFVPGRQHHAPRAVFLGFDRFGQPVYGVR